jgi:hypothetical protein
MESEGEGGHYTYPELDELDADAHCEKGVGR